MNPSTWLRSISAFALCVMAAAAAAAQAASASQEVTVVTFRQDKKIDVPFNTNPNPAFGRARATAQVELTERGASVVYADFKALPTPLNLSGRFSTYVVWAVLPDGTTQFFADIRLKGSDEVSDATFKQSIPLREFGLIVTAEPHYRVKQPSRVVLFRTGVPDRKNADAAQSRNVQCPLGTLDLAPSRQQRDPRSEREFRRTPLLAIGAGYALEIAREAGAERFASARYSEARASFDTLQAMVRRDAGDNSIDQQGIVTINIAADATEIADQKSREEAILQEKARTEAMLAASRQELEKTKGDVEKLTAELNQAKIARDLLLLQVGQKDGDVRRLETDLRTARDRTTALEVENAQLKAELARPKVVDTPPQRDSQEFITAIPSLQSFLTNYGTPLRKGDTLVFTLPEDFWVGPASDRIGALSISNMNALAKRLGEAKSAHVTIFSYGAPVGDDTAGAQALAERRAATLSETLRRNGVEPARLTTEASVLPKGPRRAAHRVEIVLKAL